MLRNHPELNRQTCNRGKGRISLITPTTASIGFTRQLSLSPCGRQSLGQETTPTPGESSPLVSVVHDPCLCKCRRPSTQGGITPHEIDGNPHPTPCELTLAIIQQANMLADKSKALHAPDAQQSRRLSSNQANHRQGVNDNASQSGCISERLHRPSQRKDTLPAIPPAQFLPPFVS
jgi:hypothetical protein